jgi:hypothetical protein
MKKCPNHRFLETASQQILRFKVSTSFYLFSGLNSEYCLPTALLVKLTQVRISELREEHGQKAERSKRKRKNVAAK